MKSQARRWRWRAAFLSVALAVPLLAGGTEPADAAELSTLCLTVRYQNGVLDTTPVNNTCAVILCALTCDGLMPLRQGL